MNIVHVEDIFFPEAGYQVNLLSRLQVKQGHSVTIITAEMEKVPTYLTAFFGKDNLVEKDKKFTERTGVKVTRIPLHGFYSGRAIYHRKIFKTVDDLKPDVLFVHGEDTLIGMQYIWMSSSLKYPIVLDCHMLEMASVNRFKKVFRWFYKNFITPIIIKNEIPLIRVVDADYVEKCLGLPLNKTILLSFGTDTDYFKPDKTRGNLFREKHGIGEYDFVILYAGKLDVYKGGQFFANAIKNKLESGKGKNIVFLIIGNTDGGEYGIHVEETFKISENKIIRFPTQAYYDLVTFYQASDLAIYPRQCSMSFFEAQSCGLPVVFETNEINTERIQYGNGFTFEPENINSFRKCMLNCIDMPDSEYQIIRDKARKYISDTYDYVPIAQQFTDVIEHQFKKFNDNK